MNKLNTFLAQIDNHIDENGFDDVMDFIPFFEDLNLSGWKSIVEKENGRPINTTIFQSEQIRLVIIYWARDQISSVHGHKEGGGLIKVLEGRLEETRFDPVEKEVTGKFLYEKGECTYIHDMIATHQVKNLSCRPTYSLHLYTRRA